MEYEKLCEDTQINLIKEQLGYYSNLLLDKKYMNTLAGKLLKTIIKNHPLFKKVLRSVDFKKDVICALSIEWSTTNIDIMMDNLGIKK